jgi:hypothetical protein
MTGSHLDTQPTGGKFDGAYGVMAGLEVMRVLHDSGYVTEAPIEVAVWTNEEGCRFAPAMVASGVFGGAFELDYALSRTDREGVSFGEALKKIGYDGKEPVGGRTVGAFFEAHIEQGPILERQNKTIGVVTGAQGQRWYEISWTGMESHAGTTPMEGRRDALVGAAELIVEARRIGNRPNGRSTVGVIESQPQSRNTIPGRVFMTLDFRHPDNDELSKMDAEMRAAAAGIIGRHRLEVKIEGDLVFPAVALRPGAGRGRAARGQAGRLPPHGHRERRRPRRLLRLARGADGDDLRAVQGRRQPEDRGRDQGDVGAGCRSCCRRWSREPIVEGRAVRSGLVSAATAALVATVAGVGGTCRSCWRRRRRSAPRRSRQAPGSPASASPRRCPRSGSACATACRSSPPGRRRAPPDRLDLGRAGLPRRRRRLRAGGGADPAHRRDPPAGPG